MSRTTRVFATIRDTVCLIESLSNKLSPSEQSLMGRKGGVLRLGSLKSQRANVFGVFSWTLDDTPVTPVSRGIVYATYWEGRIPTRAVSEGESDTRTLPGSPAPREKESKAATYLRPPLC